MTKGSETSRYWAERRNLRYYRVAVDFVRREAGGRRLIDVGGGIGLGCRYLEWLPDFDRSCVETSCGPGRIPGVRLVVEDFEHWTPDGDFDVCLCLQVVEHVVTPESFVAKMFALAPVVVLSLPYRWKAGACPHHIHDPIDEDKLLAWTGREPRALEIVEDRGVSRMVVVYRESVDRTTTAEAVCNETSPCNPSPLAVE